MQAKINESVDIEFICCIDTKRRQLSFPRKMNWRGKVIQFKKIAYYHKSKEGRLIYHIFHMSDGATDFRLKFDPEILQWKLEEVSDGNVD